MEVMDITALPRPDDTFDAVLCNHVLEHVPDDGAAMREMHRVLRPGGLAIMQHPIDTSRAETFEDPDTAAPDARMQAYGQEDHVRLYGRDFADRLVAAGFTISMRRYLDELDPSAANPVRAPRRHRGRDAQRRHLPVHRGVAATGSTDRPVTADLTPCAGRVPARGPRSPRSACRPRDVLVRRFTIGLSRRPADAARSHMSPS